MIKKTLCFTTAAYLSLRNKQMVIRLPEVDKSDMPQHTKDDAVVTRPIEDIGFVILDNKQITITSGLLSALLENECAVVSCDENCMILNLKAIHNNVDIEDYITSLLLILKDIEFESNSQLS